jgi:hypothetical protein
MPDVKAEQQELIEKAYENRRQSRDQEDDTLTFAYQPFNDIGLALLAEQNPNLQGINLRRTQVTDEAIPSINAFPNLQVLMLEATEITSAGFLKIDESLPLEELSVSYQTLTTEAAAKLASMKELTRLSLHASREDEMIEAWDEPIIEIASSETLEDLTATCHLNGACIPHIASMKSLRSLMLLGTQLEASALAGLAEIPMLYSFCLRGCGLDDACFSRFQHWTELIDLGLARCEIQNPSMPLIAKYSKLESLWLEKINVTQPACECLRRLNNLTYLEAHIEGIPNRFWQTFTKNNRMLEVHA